MRKMLRPEQRQNRRQGGMRTGAPRRTLSGAMRPRPFPGGMNRPQGGPPPGGGGGMNRGLGMAFGGGLPPGALVGAGSRPTTMPYPPGAPGGAGAPPPPPPSPMLPVQAQPVGMPVDLPGGLGGAMLKAAGPMGYGHPPGLQAPPVAPPGLVPGAPPPGMLQNHLMPSAPGGMGQDVGGSPPPPIRQRGALKAAMMGAAR